MSDGQAPNEDQTHNKWVCEFLNMKIIDPWKFGVGRYKALYGVVCQRKWNFNKMQNTNMTYEQ